MEHGRLQLHTLRCFNEQREPGGDPLLWETHKLAVKVYKEREEEMARLREEMARLREELDMVKEEKEEVEECLEEVEEDYRKSAAGGRILKIILQHERKARRELEEELDDERGGQAESQSLLDPGVLVEVQDEVGLEPGVPRTRPGHLPGL